LLSKFLNSITLLVSASLVCETGELLAQCSDAGVCAIGKIPSSLQYQVGVGYQFGRSGQADDLTFHTVQLEATIQVFEKSNLFISLPWSNQSGPLGSTSGIGDLTILWNETVWQGKEFYLSIEVGGKIATADADADKLPQAYQSGLGTNDALFGVSLSLESWNMATGYQLSRGRSNNSITRLRRGDDIFFRVGYSEFYDEIQLSGELLAIKRLGQSSVLDGAGIMFTDIAGSDQFQLNALGRFVVPLDDSRSVRVIGAVPFIQRKVNVDGLTRSVSLSLTLVMTF